MKENCKLTMLEAKERMYVLQDAVRQRDALQKQVYAAEKQLVRLQIELESKQKKTAELKRHTAGNILRSLLRIQQDEIEMAEQQEQAALHDYHAALQDHEDAKAKFQKNGQILSEYRSAEQDYKKLLAEAEQKISCNELTAVEFSTIDKQIAIQAEVTDGLEQTLKFAKRIAVLLESASDSLDGAETMSHLDIWSGGDMIMTHLKHKRIGEAQELVKDAQHQLRQLKGIQDKLSGLHVEFDISRTLKTTDYWFDNIVTDWIVQGRIYDSQEQVLEARRQVRNAIKKLSQEYDFAMDQLTRLKNKRLMRLEYLADDLLTY